MTPTVMQTQRTNSYKGIGSSGNTCLYDFPYFVTKCGWRDGPAAEPCVLRLWDRQGGVKRATPGQRHRWAVSLPAGCGFQGPHAPPAALRVPSSVTGVSSVPCLRLPLSGSVLLAAAEAERGERQAGRGQARFGTVSFPFS